MRARLVLLAILVAFPTLARADMASYEREQKQKRARLVQLDDMLVEAMAVAPASFTAAADIERAAARIEQLTATVRGELAGNALIVAGPTRGKVQLNLNKVDDRLKAVKLTARAAAVLARIAPIAKVHGEPAAADLDEAARLVGALRARRGAYPAGADAMTSWHGALLATLAEVPWPSQLRPLEVSRSGLARGFLPINSTIEGTREQSIAILDVTTELRDLDRHGAAFTGVSFTLWGPVTEQGGIVAGTMKAHDWKNLAPGTYLLRARGRGPSTSFRIVLSSPETPRERLLQVGSIPADAPLELRRADAIFPFLGETRAPHVRQDLFLRAPREAFVYAREDITAADTHDVADEGPFPERDEPLLVTGPGDHGRGLRVINAEGLAWTLRDTRLLAVAPAGPPALPARIHRVDLSFEMVDLKAEEERFTNFESDAQAPIIAKHVATIERWNACVDKVHAKYGGAVANDFVVVTYRAGKISNVEGLSEKAWKEADRTCKTKQYEAQLRAFDQELSEAHNRQRSQRLDRIRAAWSR